MPFSPLRLRVDLPTCRPLTGIGMRMAMGIDYVVLQDRGVLSVEGAEHRSFLQGLISNDVDKVAPNRAIYAALLTPQGKYLFDFIIAQQADCLLLDVERARLPALLQRLMLYKLRAKVDLADRSDSYAIAAMPSEAAAGAFDLPLQTGAARAVNGGVVMVDPRLTRLGVRALLPAARLEAELSARAIVVGDREQYDRLRLEVGVPDGSRDLIVDKATLLESGFEELHGIDFKKGCFVGQELTARMKYRGLVRKRLMPVIFDGAPPSPGSIVRAGKREIGEIRSALHGRGLALLRLDRLAEAENAGQALMADGLELHPQKPDWVNF